MDDGTLGSQKHVKSWPLFCWQMQALGYYFTRTLEVQVVNAKDSASEFQTLSSMSVTCFLLFPSWS